MSIRKDDGERVSNRCEWSPWEQKFAWLPKRIIVRCNEGRYMITFTKIVRTEWIWLKKYWQRERLTLYYSPKGAQYEYDHAVDVFDMMLPGK